MSKTIARCFVFPSSSGSGTYQTLQYSDGTTSCDCKGWTRRIDAQGNRSCKHTRDIDAGIAQRTAQSFVDYNSRQTSTTPSPMTSLPTVKTRTPKPTAERVFSFD